MRTEHALSHAPAARVLASQCVARVGEMEIASDWNDVLFAA